MVHDPLFIKYSNHTSIGI